MNLNPYQIINVLWSIIAILWLAGGFINKPTARTQTPSSRWFQIAALILAFTLMFKQRMSIGILAHRFVPGSPLVTNTGLLLTCAGILFAAWARITLGRNWSASVTVKQDHALIRRGPYSIVRHPIYSGLLLAMLGTALVIGQVRCLLATAILFVAWSIKLRIEETFMLQQFGPEYAQYQREVKGLIPLVF